MSQKEVYVIGANIFDKGIISEISSAGFTINGYIIPKNSDKLDIFRIYDQSYLNTLITFLVCESITFSSNPQRLRYIQPDLSKRLN